VTETSGNTVGDIAEFETFEQISGANVPTVGQPTQSGGEL
jgi:hypothetical protein